MVVDIAKGWTIEAERKVWIITHKFKTPFGIELKGVDGVFNDEEIAKKALEINKADKPNWEFTLNEDYLITKMYRE